MGALALALVTPLAVAPSAVADTKDSAALRTELADLEREVASEESRLEALQRQIDELLGEINDTEQRREEIITELSERVASAYRYGVGDVTMAVVLSGSQDPVEMADSITKLDVVNDGDVDAEAEAAEIAAQLNQQQADLDLVLAQQEKDISSLLDRKQILAARVAAKEAAERAAQAAAQAAAQGGSSALPPGSYSASGGTPIMSGSMACPITAPYHFIDSYGAPRSGGRGHAGVDMFAQHGSPLYAVESGVVERARNKGGIGGLYIWLVGDSGNEYYYAHNSANYVSAGQRVSAGQKIGAMGNTGNASGHPSHLHWEVHPGGGGAVNPTPMARRLCP